MRALVVAMALATSLALAGCEGQPNWSQWTAWAKKFLGHAPATATPSLDTAAKDSFKGTVQAEWLHPPRPADYFRDMRLLAPFGYVGPDGTHWDVPAGYVTNGASVPWGLWNLVGGPYDGPYRDAAVIHDYFCEKKNRPWEEVHRMFYDAAKARGTSETLAQTMYAALRFGGPRWEVSTPVAATRGVSPATDLTASSPGAATSARKVDPGLTRGASKTQQQQFEDLQKWIEETKPSLAEIERRVEQLRQLNGMQTTPQR
jgi:hypothetical protein